MGGSSSSDDSVRLVFSGNTKGEGVTIRYDTPSSTSRNYIGMNQPWTSDSRTTAYNAGYIQLEYVPEGYSPTTTGSVKMGTYFYIDIEDVSDYDYLVLNVDISPLNPYWYPQIRSNGTTLHSKTLRYSSDTVSFYLKNYTITGTLTLQIVVPEGGSSNNYFRLYSAFLVKNKNNIIIS